MVLEGTERGADLVKGVIMRDDGEDVGAFWHVGTA